MLSLRCSACCYLDSSLGDADGLLFHGFVDGHLVLQVHLVKLINAAHTLEEALASVPPNTLKYTSERPVCDS